MPKVSDELDKLFDELLEPGEKQLVYEQIGQKLPHTFRFNPLKGPQDKLIEFFREQGFGFHNLPGRDDIFQITYQPYPIGRSLSHFLGHIYVQDIASMIPSLVLNPQPGDWVLDMSAAPGSKTTHMGSMMENEGVLLANDIVGKRLRALGKNVERWTLCNVAIYKWYGEQFGNAYFEQFDKVLLDPGCSGLGTLHKNPEVLGWWTPAHCQRLADSQKSMMISAIKALRPGGVLTYSTCTVAPVENEGIIDFALREFPVEVEEISLPEIRTWPGVTEHNGQSYHPDVQKTVRLYPVDRITEGFYVARLRKTGPMKEPDSRRRKPARKVNYLSHKTSPVKKYLDQFSGHFEIPRKVFADYTWSMRNHIYAMSRDVREFQFYGEPIQNGLRVAETSDRGARFNTIGAHLFGQHAQNFVVNISDLETLEKYANRDKLDIPVNGRGQVIVKYKDLVIGYGYSDSGYLKSQFPKGDWEFKVVVDK